MDAALPAASGPAAGVPGTEPAVWPEEADKAQLTQGHVVFRMQNLQWQAIIHLSSETLSKPLMLNTIYLMHEYVRKDTDEDISKAQQFLQTMMDHKLHWYINLLLLC